MSPTSRPSKSATTDRQSGLFTRTFNEFPKLSQDIWDQKYRLRTADGVAIDRTIDDTWKRIANEVAKVEPKSDRSRWARKFHNAMKRFEFLPAGRIIAGAGADRDVTLFNCFVMGKIEDDMTSIFENLKEAGLTMQRGGGIGHDFSTLRPKGAYVHGVGAEASGPVSFMELWNTMCQTIMSAGARRGAMMATMRCDHPDIEDFISAKSQPGRLTNFNLSVLVTDAFMSAVKADQDWPLVFEGKTYKTVRARALWDTITRATYEYAEPGVIFIDRINAANNLAYCETINATNPCGEQPLPPYGACLLGSINLASLVNDPFSRDADLDLRQLRKRTKLSVRFLDNVIDISRYPLPEQEREAKEKRRIGLGVTGLADALIMCGETYGSDNAIARTRQWLEILRNAAYEASCELAREKGTFPLYDRDAIQAAPNIAALPKPLRKSIARHGLRNGLLTSIAPTGTISLLAGNVSSGIEPVFDFSYERTILQPDGSRTTQTVRDFSVEAWEHVTGKKQSDGLPPQFVSAQSLPPEAHIRMQAAAQEFIDSAISKTINCPQDISFEEFQSVYDKAFQAGLKGCTTYRPSPLRGSVLTTVDDDTAANTKPENANDPGNVPRIMNTDTQDDVVYLSEPLARPGALIGKTYKLKWPASPHAYYVTINDMVDDAGKSRPFEIFINSKNLEHYAWTVALTRMISAVFRRGGDVSFVMEELQEVFDPTGGHWQNGAYVPSLIAAIGKLIEKHMRSTGFLPAHEDNERAIPQQKLAGADAPTFTPQLSSETIENGASAGRNGRFCPKCGQQAFVRQDGCFVCRACGYSKCS